MPIDIAGLVYRGDKTPAADPPVGGELSQAEFDGNTLIFAVALALLQAEKMDESEAVDVGGPLEPESGDFLVLFRGGVPYYFLIDDVPGNMTGDDIVALLEDLVGSARLNASAIDGLTPGDPVTVTHDGAGATPVTGDTLTAVIAPGWSGSIHWQRAGVDIVGATSDTYTLVGADEDQVIRPVYTAHVFTAPGVTPTAAPSTPAAFGGGDWDILDATTIDVAVLPASATSIVALEIDVNEGTPIALSGTTVNEYTISTLVDADSVRIRAENAAGAGPWSTPKVYTESGGGTLTFVQGARNSNGWIGALPVTLPGAMTATNGALLCLKTATDRGAPVSVLGSDGVTFGAAIATYDADGQTHRYYRRANCPALTGATATMGSEGPMDLRMEEVVGGGATISVEGTGGTAQTGATVWEFPVAPAVTGTYLFGVCDLSLDTSVTGASTVTATPGTAEYTQYFRQALAASGAQTPQMTLTSSRDGHKSWVLLRAGA